MKGQVLVYSIVGCVHCKAAKSSLQEKGIQYVDISIDKYESSVREQLKEKTGKSTVPQIFFNAKFVGGNDSLQELIKNEEEWSKLIELLNESPSSDAPSVPDPSLLLPDDEDKDAGDFKCEPDEYAKLVIQLKSCGIIQDNRRGLSNHKNTFTGQEFIMWMKKEHTMGEAESIMRGQHLIDNHFIHKLKSDDIFENNDKLYRLLEDDDSNALNHGDTNQCEAKSVNELGEALRKLILKIYNKHLSSDGKKVDYKGISESSDFKAYTQQTLLLHRVRIEDASREEKLAFFINIYNALVIHANVVRGPPTNIWQRYKFFNTVRYIIGGQTYSLQDIENGVLRANRKGVGMIFRPFGKEDPRLKVALKEPEPFIHFALVCGAKSCPPIKTYSANGIMDQLKLAAESFLEGDDGCKVNSAQKTISLSKIFSWYKEDFGGSNQTLVDWILANMSAGEKQSEMSAIRSEGKYRVQFLTYDWGVNS